MDDFPFSSLKMPKIKSYILLKMLCTSYGSEIVRVDRKIGVNPLSANPTKWSNTLKQFVDILADELFEYV